MKNKGNTCFFNATVQCLLSMPGFINYIKGSDFSRGTKPVSCALRDLVYDYQNFKIFDPQDFIRVIRGRIKLFDGRQQDAHCFLDALLETLVEEQGRDTKLKNMFKIVNEDLINCKKCNYSNVVRSEGSTQYLFIEGAVQRSLQSYITNDDIINANSEWVCPGCGGSAGLRIRHRIIETSEYIIIHLNRFSEMDRKNHKAITIDDEIRVNNRVYQSIGVVCHVGNLHSGHYFSKGKRDDTWYEFNDSMVTKSKDEFEPDQPYILFYAAKE